MLVGCVYKISIMNQIAALHLLRMHTARREMSSSVPCNQRIRCVTLRSVSHKKTLIENWESGVMKNFHVLSHHLMLSV